MVANVDLKQFSNVVREDYLDRNAVKDITNKAKREFLEANPEYLTWWNNNLIGDKIFTAVGELKVPYETQTGVLKEVPVIIAELIKKYPLQVAGGGHDGNDNSVNFIRRSVEKIINDRTQKFLEEARKVAEEERGIAELRKNSPEVYAKLVKQYVGVEGLIKEGVGILQRRQDEARRKESSEKISGGVINAAMAQEFVKEVNVRRGSSAWSDPKATQEVQNALVGQKYLGSWGSFKEQLHNDIGNHKLVAKKVPERRTRQSVDGIAAAQVGKLYDNIIQQQNAAREQRNQQLREREMQRREADANSAARKHMRPSNLPGRKAEASSKTTKTTVPTHDIHGRKLPTDRKTHSPHAKKNGSHREYVAELMRRRVARQTRTETFIAG